jgi:hypothetical protein
MRSRYTDPLRATQHVSSSKSALLCILKTLEKHLRPKFVTCTHNLQDYNKHFRACIAPEVAFLIHSRISPGLIEIGKSVLPIWEQLTCTTLAFLALLAVDEGTGPKHECLGDHTAPNEAFR